MWQLSACKQQPEQYMAMSDVHASWTQALALGQCVSF